MPKLTGETLVDGAIRFALATIPQEEQEKLFASLGYDTEDIDLDLCRKAWDECGEEFTKPFFTMAHDQLDDEDKMRAVKKQVLAKMSSFSRADGKKTDTDDSSSANKTTFDNEKWENSKSVIGYIFGLCESGYKTYADAKSQANAAAIAAEQQAEVAKAQAAAQQNTTKWILIGGGVLVLVIVIIAVIIAMRKK